MKTYAVLLRGINVGGNNKVAMADLRQKTADLGFEDVRTYINSGNLFFKTDIPRPDITAKLRRLFAADYPFIQHFSLFTENEYAQDYQNLPDWWFENIARKDVLFFTEDMDRKAVIARIKSFSLRDESVHFGELGIYWGKYTEASYLKTTYHKQLLKEDFYRQVTIRNSKTAAKILHFLQQ